MFVGTSALTGAAVVPAALRIYFGLGPRTTEDVDPGPTTSGEEDAETDTLLQRLPLTMLVPIVVLLGASVALGVLPGVGAAVAGAAATFLDAPGYVVPALVRPHRPRRTSGGRSRVWRSGSPVPCSPPRWPSWRCGIDGCPRRCDELRVGSSRRWWGCARCTPATAAITPHG